MSVHVLLSGGSDVNEPDFTHPIYKETLTKWQRCRDFIDGEDVVKSKDDYLPKLGGQTPTEYKGYKARAWFLPATSRTVEALLGMIFRKAPITEIPKTRSDLLEDISVDGSNLETFSKCVSDEVFNTGRVGVLTDIPTDPEVAVSSDGQDTIPEIKKKPYLTFYTAESILNWETDIKEGKERLVRVVLLETAHEKDGKFGTKLIKKLRILILEGGTYKVEMWRENAAISTGSAKYILENELVPVKLGVALDFIPFVIINSKSISSKVEKPPLLDLVNVNASHFLTSADLEHGRHFTGLPMMWLSGFDTDTKVTIGSQRAIVAQDANAKAGYLEFTGQGLQSLENGSTEKKEMMAMLGARLLQSEKSGVEAAETAKIKKSSESGVLQTLASTVETGITRALWTLVWWVTAGDLDKKLVSIGFNNDFLDIRLTPQELKVLMEQVQGGIMSLETYFFNLKRGEMYPEHKTIEEEVFDIENGIFAISQGTVNDKDDDKDDDKNDKDDEDENDKDEEDETEQVT